MREILLRTNMNITLENFLKHIFGDRSGKVPNENQRDLSSHYYNERIRRRRKRGAVPLGRQRTGCAARENAIRRPRKSP